MNEAPSRQTSPEITHNIFVRHTRYGPWGILPKSTVYKAAEHSNGDISFEGPVAAGYDQKFTPPEGEAMVNVPRPVFNALAEYARDPDNPKYNSGDPQERRLVRGKALPALKSALGNVATGFRSLTS